MREERKEKAIKKKMESKLFEKKKSSLEQFIEAGMILCLRSTGRCLFLKGGGKGDIISSKKLMGRSSFSWA
ncbi:hypothetical protein CEXT_778621 [Caerostris extrusa]|uniref:Uncharacterized protein n=1 Tax=Caerostris extrusa TaxID=172846 RepID=A0AAV4V4F3_CAEEX|nr:hypothetical protein CEXT_778621 [Caerostris extrusa]